MKGLLLATALLLSACGAPQSELPPERVKGELIIVETGGSRELHCRTIPTTATGFVNGSLITLTFDQVVDCGGYTNFSKEKE